MTIDIENLSPWQQPQIIQSALQCKQIAVVGMSSNELRPSNEVGYYMLRNGYEITPVNPRETQIYGRTSYPTLHDVPHRIEIVNVFRDSSAVPEIAEAAVAIGAKFLWLQLGVISAQGIAIAEAGGVQCIVDKCIKIEHARY
jgi:predicted CoA-binding protein